MNQNPQCLQKMYFKIVYPRALTGNAFSRHKDLEIERGLSLDDVAFMSHTEQLTRAFQSEHTSLCLRVVK